MLQFSCSTFSASSEIMFWAFSESVADLPYSQTRVWVPVKCWVWLWHDEPHSQDLWNHTICSVLSILKPSLNAKETQTSFLLINISIYGPFLALVSILDWSPKNIFEFRDFVQRGLFIRFLPLYSVQERHPWDTPSRGIMSPPGQLRRVDSVLRVL